MKKITLLLIFAIAAATGWGQIVTTNPQFPTSDGGNIVITYNAASTEGNLGLKGYTGDVYAHIGVITSASTSSSDWKYVLTPWPKSSNLTLANTTANKLTRTSTDTYTLTISPTLRGFLNIPASETIKKIALVFRSADGTKTGKTSSGGDIFIDLAQPGLNVAFSNPSSNQVLTAGTAMNIQVGASLASNLELFINGSSVKTSTSATSLSYNYTFSSKIDYTLIAKATSGATIVYDTAYVCVPAAPVTQTRPSGTLPGINYIDNNSVTLVLQAPNKSRAFVVGEMTDWITKNAYQMKKDGEYFWITLTGLTAGKIYGYQYQVDDTIKVSDPYTEMVLDPWNDQWINYNSTIYPNLKPYPANKTTGIVATFQTAKPAYTWTTPTITVPSRDNMVIYEMLVRDFTPERTLEAAVTKLDYLKTLGITAVELMPVTEFDGNDSWGYNPNHYFAPDKAYGTSNNYKKFIDECHARGIAVILDMVFNHATGNSPFAGLYWDKANNRPAANSPYMNAIAPHADAVFNDFNHSNATVREHFKRALQYWVNEYKVDGFRFDLSKGFTQGAGTSYDANRVSYILEYQEAVKAVKADAMFILEHWGPSDEEAYLATKGIYMWMNNTTAYQQSAMGFQNNPSSSFSGMIRSPRQWVGYAESHDEERTFYKAKMWGNKPISTDSISRIARVPLNIAFEVLIPGPKMLWEFQELGYDYGIDSNGGRTSAKPSAWGWLNLAHRKAAYDNCSKILNLRKNYSNAFTNGTWNYNVSVSDWSQGRRIALTHSDLDMIVVGNFDATTTVTANPSFQKTGTWYELLTGNTLTVSSTSMTLSLAPGEVRIYTDRVIDTNDAVINPSVKADCLIYPSVTTGKLYISSDSDIKDIRVYSVQGSLVKADYNKTDIDISSLINGIYLMEVTTPNGKTIQKVVKQ